MYVRGLFMHDRDLCNLLNNQQTGVYVLHVLRVDDLRAYLFGDGDNPAVVDGIKDCQRGQYKRHGNRNKYN